MNYWPLSMLRESPLMPPEYVWELQRFYTHPPSGPVFYACLNVAQNTVPLEMPGLAIVESVGAPNRLIFTEYPNWEQWARLERAGAFQNDAGYLFVMMDSLH
jgi:hypothetical protein